MKIRIGGRMMLLVWRTRACVARLLQGMLARSLRHLSIGAATTFAVIGGPLAIAAPLAVNALPTGGAVVAGQAAVSQTANTMNVVQTSQNAILNWNTFNIGAGARVNFQQPNATAATLNRVTTNDPSALMGRLTANGKVWLINPAGIMVGKDARIDVAGFVASTLNVRDEDFLANRLNFSGGAAAGKVQNFGAITTPSGGSVYLVGGGVENQGVITAPGGEVLLAAGHSVQMIDTGTPGVKVEITGSEGTTTNLGQILGEAGRIGMAGVLVKNAGVIDASSVSKEGGRIFLQAAGSLVTESTSRLSADGTSGGRITLNAENSATIDGSISAQGFDGRGGFVETSGKTQLSVVATPSIGRGGEWLIDPNNITIQAAGSPANTTSGPTFSSTNDTSIVTTGLIEAALNAGTSVTITTSSLGANTQAGNITLASPIAKTDGLDASLTLTANNSIFINQSIASTAGALTLSLNANSAGGQNGSVNIASAVDLNGGAMNVAGPLVLNGASLSGLQLNAGGLVSFAGNTSLNTNVSLANAALSGGTLQGTGKLTATNLKWLGGTIAGGTNSPAYDVTNLTLSGLGSLDGRTLNLVAGGVSRASSASLTFKNSAALNNAGTLTVADGTQLGYYYSPGAGSSAINNSGTVNSTNTLNYATTNTLGGSYDALNFTAFNNTGTVNVTDGTLQLSGGGTHTGSFNVSASGQGKISTLGFGGNTYYSTGGRPQNINDGAIFTETGTNGGVATVNLSDVSFSSTNLNTNVSLANAAVSSGTLQGTGKLTATNLNWSGGTIAGGTNSPAYDVTNLTLSGLGSLDGRTLNLVAGGVSRASSASLTFKNSAALNNAGTLTVADGTQLGYYYSPGAGSSAINNSGTVNSTNTLNYATTNTLGGSYDALNFTAFNNTGTVNVTDGTLQLSGGGTHTGSFNVSASGQGKISTLGFGGNTYYSTGGRPHNINDGATFTETDTSGGVATVMFSDYYYNDNSAINLNTDVSLTHAALSGGTLQGTGKLTATNLNWSGGTIAGGATSPAYDVTNLALSGSETLDGRTLNLVGGGVSRASSASLTFKNSAVLNNAGTLTVADGTQLGYYYSPGAGSSAINNSGTVNSTNTSIYLTTNTLGGNYDALNFTAFNNTGAVNVTDGVLQLSGGGTHTGAFNVSASAPAKTSALSFGGNTYYGGVGRAQNVDAGATFTEKSTNSGVATVVFSDYYNNNNSAINLNTDVSLENAALSGGTLQGTGKLSATNLKWSGGTIAGGANSPAYDVTNLTLNGSETLDGRTLNLVADGVSRASGAYLTFKNSAVLNNVGTLTVADGTQLGYYYSTGAGSSVINNNGTVNSTNTSTYSTTNTVGGKYDTLNSIAFNNAGSLNVTDGTLQVSGGGALVNNGQIRVDTGATLSTGNRDLTNAPSGVLSGNGTVNVGATSTLINNGAVAPGTPEATGTLTVTGNYTQGSTGNLVARIGGVASNQHDLLQVSGNVRLDGALTATALNNYVAGTSDAVTLIGGTPQTSTISGTFRTVSAPPDLYAGYGLYSGAPFRLTYAPGGTIFFGNGGGDFSWSNPLNWSGRSLPVQGNDVQINAGYTVQHGSGNDAVSSLAIEQNNGLSVSGGVISVANLSRVNGKLAISSSGSVVLNGGLSGTGLLALDGGSATLKGISGIANLAVTSGVLTGDSDFTVSNSFSQTGGSLMFRTAAVDLRQNTGDLVIGNLSAASAKLESVTGAILEGPPSINPNSFRTQSFARVILEEPASISVNALTTRSASGTQLDSGANAIGAIAATNSGSGNVSVTTTGSLSVSQISDIAGIVTINAGDSITQTGGITAAGLRTTSGTGTRLDGANAVGSFSATNARSGDIVLVNTTRPNTLSVAGVTNNGGGVMIDNTGAILTSGDITAAQGALLLTAHSPITVSSVLAARDGITLNALPSPLATDTIAVNGTLTSATGSIALVAGTSALVNESASFSVSPGSGISLTALGGAVSVLSGATFFGATPTITQSLPTAVSPPLTTPPPVVAPGPNPPAIFTLPAPGSGPEAAPLAGGPGALSTTIDSIQKTTASFGNPARTPALLSVVDSGGGNGSLSGYPGERLTIGGSVDSFGGVSSTGKNAGDSDNTGDASGRAPSTDANRTPKSLPVCS